MQYSFIAQLTTTLRLRLDFLTIKHKIMFVHTEETLLELEDYIKQLEEKHGLTPKTAIEVYKAIEKERKQLKKLIIDDVIVPKGTLCLDCEKKPAITGYDMHFCEDCWDNAVD